MSLLAAVHFPPIEHLVEWPSFLGGDWYGFNKIALINVVAVVVPLVLFLIARRGEMVPRGVQNLVEVTVNFIKDGIVMQTIGPDGMRYVPFLLSIFLFVLIGNIFEVIPGFQMPANARMANPALLALITLVMFVAVGIKHQGPLHYWKTAVVPPGVPFALLFLVVPIELLSTFIIRPFSLAVRLFANMLAGHILLVTFGVLSITLFSLTPLVLALPFSAFMLIALTGFEVMVSFLQAYIFTILAAVYIGGALHPEH